MPAHRAPTGFADNLVSPGPAGYGCCDSLMIRTSTALVPAFALCGLFACAANSDSAPVPEDDRVGAFVGGWDGEATEGQSVLLIRDGLTGTLSAAHLIGEALEYRVTYDIDGEADQITDDIVLGLGCAEVTVRPRADLSSAEPSDDDNADGGSDGADADADADAEQAWSSLDCAGWELDLQCGLAGNCEVGDCNMLCDVVYFGDAYATASVALTVVEDEFDHWQRV